MPAFQQQYPELDATTPLMDGDLPQARTPLNQMRRQQLHDLARAYDLSLGDTDTKEYMMPSMKAAQKSGLFNRPPKHPEFARKAMQHSDQVKDASRSNSFAA